MFSIVNNTLDLNSTCKLSVRGLFSIISWLFLRARSMEHVLAKQLRLLCNV